MVSVVPEFMPTPGVAVGTSSCEGSGAFRLGQHGRPERCRWCPQARGRVAFLVAGRFVLPVVLQLPPCRVG